LLHGTGGDENDLLALGEWLAPGAALLSPRGKIREGAQPRFFRRHGGAQWDFADFRARTAELAEFVAAARTHYGLGKPVAVGFSNGANIGWSLLLHAPTALAGAILIRPMLPFDPRPLPDLEGLPVLILTGMEDTLIPHDQPVLLAALLGEAGANATFEMVPGGHGLTAQDVSLATSWLRDHVMQH
jgi:phospholipase/carboxylesterase